MYNKYLPFICMTLIFSLSFGKNSKEVIENTSYIEKIIENSIQKHIENQNHFSQGRNAYLLHEGMKHLGIYATTPYIWVREYFQMPKNNKSPKIVVEVLKVNSHFKNYQNGHQIYFTNLQLDMEFSGYGYRQNNEYTTYVWREGIGLKLISSSQIPGYNLYEEVYIREEVSLFHKKWSGNKLTTPISKFWFIKEVQESNILIKIQAKKKQDDTNRLYIDTNNILIYMKIRDISKSDINLDQLSIVTNNSKIQLQYWNWITNSSKENIRFGQVNKTLRNVLLYRNYIGRLRQIESIVDKVRKDWKIENQIGYISMHSNKSWKKAQLVYLSDPFSHTRGLSKITIDFLQTNTIEHMNDNRSRRQTNDTILTVSTNKFDFLRYQYFNKQKINIGSPPFFVVKKNGTYFDITKSIIYQKKQPKKAIKSNLLLQLSPEKDMVNRNLCKYWYHAYNQKNVYLYIIRDDPSYIKVWQVKKLVMSKYLNNVNYYEIMHQVPDIYIKMNTTQTNSGHKINTILQQINKQTNKK